MFKSRLQAAETSVTIARLYALMLIGTAAAVLAASATFALL